MQICGGETLHAVFDTLFFFPLFFFSLELGKTEYQR